MFGKLQISNCYKFVSFTRLTIDESSVMRDRGFHADTADLRRKNLYERFTQVVYGTKHRDKMEVSNEWQVEIINNKIQKLKVQKSKSRRIRTRENFAFNQSNLHVSYT